jgi:hypothetical protein
MANKILPLMILFISSLFLVNIPGACLAQPDDNAKISKQDTSSKNLTMDRQIETKQDRKIKNVQGLKILELREAPVQSMTKATDYTRKEPAAPLATDE